MEHIIERGMLDLFRSRLIDDEKSEATLEKYTRDVEAFIRYVGIGSVITKDVTLHYKKHLIKKYAVTSANSMLAALNRFFREMGWLDCIVKSFKVQREAFRSKERELSKAEYLRLLSAAQKRGNQRLYLLMETICSTGIRVSELQAITVESLLNGRAIVSLKGKTRVVMLPAALCRALKSYVKKRKIKEGSIFVTRTGKPMDRSNILHAMKALCREAKVDCRKVFPHNLRHLFACTYYKMEKDISHLADILGHSNINTTRIYTRASGEEQIKQINRMGLILEQIKETA